MKKFRNSSERQGLNELNGLLLKVQECLDKISEILGRDELKSSLTEEMENIKNAIEQEMKLERIKEGNYNTLVVNQNGEAFVFHYDGQMPEVFGFMEYSGGKGTFSNEIQVSNEDYEVLKEILKKNGGDVIEISLDAIIKKNDKKNDNEYRSLTENPTEDRVFEPVDVKKATKISEEDLKVKLKEAGATDEIVQKVIDMIYMAYSGICDYDNIFIRAALEQGKYDRLISLAMNRSVTEPEQYHNLATGVRSVMMKAQEYSQGK